MAGAKFKTMMFDDPTKHFKGKTIRVTGTVTEYMSHTEIIVTDPEQITIVEK